MLVVIWSPSMLNTNRRGNGKILGIIQNSGRIHHHQIMITKDKKSEKILLLKRGYKSDVTPLG